MDDLCRLRARTRFAAQFIAALAICALGIRIESLAVTSWFTIRFGWLSWPITILWVAGITNAINFVDGLDGLAAGISAIVCGVIAVVGIYTGNTVMAVLMLALLGSLTGFLLFNFNPARLFMGDCGSMFLGFLLGGASVMCAAKSVTVVSMALPFLALGVPIFDMLFSMLRRLLERRSMFSPDRSHIHHRLLDMGLRQRHVVLFIYLVTFVVAALGMFMMCTRDAATLVLFGCLILLIMLLFRIVGAVRLRDSIARMKSNLATVRNHHDHKCDYDKAVLFMRRARTFDDWWQALCVAAAEMNLVWISLDTIGRDGDRQTNVWRNQNLAPDLKDLVEISVPVRYQHNGEKIRLAFAVAVNNSLESSGHSTALFTRLVDEYSPANLREVRLNQTV